MARRFSSRVSQRSHPCAKAEMTPCASSLSARPVSDVRKASMSLERGRHASPLSEAAPCSQQRHRLLCGPIVSSTKRTVRSAIRHTSAVTDRGPLIGPASPSDLTNARSGTRKPRADARSTRNLSLIISAAHWYVSRKLASTTKSPSSSLSARTVSVSASSSSTPISSSLICKRCRCRTRINAEGSSTIGGGHEPTVRQSTDGGPTAPMSTSSA
eukprot:4037798-Pleurochrysis_carterae.AAC.2